MSNPTNPTPEKGKYQIMPEHSPEAYAELNALMAEHGLQQALVYDDDGNLLDGFARERICMELNIPCDQKDIRRFGSEAEKLAFILSVNMPRRQFGIEEKESLIRAYLLKDTAICDNTLAKLIGGVSKNTVADVRAEMETACLIDKVEQRRGTDGKMYPAKYPRIVVNTAKEMEAALKAIKDLPANGKSMDAMTAARRARRNKNTNSRQGHIVTPLPEDAIKLYHCRFQELEQVAGIAPASVNSIITDIPYGKDFLPQIAELGAMAARVLIEGGLFVMYSGQYHLDKVIQALGEHLTYRWTTAFVWRGDANLVFPLDLGSQWKPILIYSKGPWKQRDRWHDVIMAELKQKTWHPWEQPIDQIETLVQQFSNSGDLVLDPCGGGFTTAVACHNLGRRCISCDVDLQAVLAGQERLAMKGDKINVE